MSRLLIYFFVYFFSSFDFLYDFSFFHLRLHSIFVSTLHLHFTSLDGYVVSHMFGVRYNLRPLNITIAKHICNIAVGNFLV